MPHPQTPGNPPQPHRKRGQPIASFILHQICDISAPCYGLTPFFPPPPATSHLKPPFSPLCLPSTVVQRRSHHTSTTFSGAPFSNWSNVYKSLFNLQVSHSSGIRVPCCIIGSLTKQQGMRNAWAEPRGGGLKQDGNLPSRGSVLPLVNRSASQPGLESRTSRPSVPENGTFCRASGVQSKTR
jgi:hypothetical protein